MPKSASRLWPPASEDRRRAGSTSTFLVAMMLGLSFRTALSSMHLQDSGHLVTNAATLTAFVATMLLRSIPLRWIVRTYTLIGGVLMIRFGWLAASPGVVSVAAVIGWASFAAVAFALSPRPAGRIRGAARSTRLPVDDGRSNPSPAPDAVSAAGVGGGFSAAVRGGVAVAVVVVAVTAVVGPAAGRRSAQAPSNGAEPDPYDRGPDNALSVQPTLDMTTRPRLTDAVVMTVTSGVETFWRTTTYDRWNGAVWSLSDSAALHSVPLDGRVASAPDDVAAVDGRPSTQVVRLQSRFANALPVAASVVSVRSDVRLLQRADGSLIAPEGLGQGAVYTLHSRQPDVTIAELDRDRGPIPQEIADRYARPATTTARVRALAEDVAGAAPTQLAKVQALEGWMGRNLTYSIGAPLSPEGVDVVDDFLFDSKEGWCEQIASSLVVMLREVGVPARLATGFAPGQLDRVSGRFVVRERDAHAWTEVWFPGVGWVPFDPTASVPLAGDADARVPAVPVGFGPLAVVMLFVAALLVVAGPLARRLHAWRERRSHRRAARRLAAERWDVRVEQELEALGREVGRPRLPSETVSAHARELAAVTGRSELEGQGRAVDDLRYRPPSS